MTTRIRLLMLMARPSVVVLLGLFAATGVAEAGGAKDVAVLARVLVAVVSLLVCAVVMNDFADRAADQVNLPGDASRLWASGRCTHQEMVVAGVTAGAVALVAGALLGRVAFLVVVAGLALSAAYSLPPLRLAGRGVLASLLLPAGYVAVPYLAGIFSLRPSLHGRDLALLAALYVGFIGRILLKDFRDVRGDALFGKRTFLVRHGRRATCIFSAICWVAGLGVLAAVRSVNPVLAAGESACVGLSLALLRHLAVEGGPRRDERLISAIAIAGRGMVLLLLAHLSMVTGRLSAAATLSIEGALTLLIVGSAWAMATYGPQMVDGVPEAWMVEMAVADRRTAAAGSGAGGSHGD